MHLEQRIQKVEHQIKILIDIGKDLTHKLDLALKNKKPKEKFEEINAAGFYTNKQVQIECKLSEKSVHNFLKDYPSIRRQKFDGHREHFIHLGDFKDAKQNGRTSFDKEVFNKPKQQKAA